MTAISSLGVGQMNSPLSRLQSELTSQVSAGAISSDDQRALSAALTDIDSALRGQGAQGGPPPSPEEMQSKLNDLIENEVKNGKLTSDQASELKDVFAKAFQGGPHGAGGPPKAGSSETDSLLDLLSSDSTGESSSDDVSQLISDFLKSLQASQSSSSTYNASGSSLISQIQSLVVNTSA